MTRKAVVSGMFYEGTKDALNKQVEKFIVKDVVREKVFGVVSPHAGFIYSGKTAGDVYSRITPPDTFVIMGPNHTGLGEIASIMTEGSWETPLGAVQIDNILAEAIIKRSRYLINDRHAHTKEHSIEVQLPFMQYLFSGFKIVPICIMGLDYKICLDIGEAISRAVMESRSNAVIVASTDMTHYESHRSAQSKDLKVIEFIKSMDHEGLFKHVVDNGITMCGIAPTTSALIACKALGATSANLVRYMTSGEVSGDYDRVVGYAGLTIK